uniref:Single domain-containing protein n=1 Tax=Timema cristinae TaxID=61476 RepID=A0A7R9GUG7_TIMCR|nr:unnamed protein product [Timema cristinae]
MPIQKPLHTALPSVHPTLRPPSSVNYKLNTIQRTLHSTDIRTSISPSSAVELNTTRALVKYSTEARYPGKCWDKELSKAFDPGDNWVKRGQCAEFSCNKFKETFYINKNGCGIQIFSRSMGCIVKVNTTVEYPECCPIHYCPKSKSSRFEHTIKEQRGFVDHSLIARRRSGRYYDLHSYYNTPMRVINLIHGRRGFGGSRAKDDEPKYGIQHWEN